MITVLVFSYNRHPFLLRQIQYWSKYPEFQLLIVDGSSVPLDLSSIPDFPDNVTYIYQKCSASARLQLGLEKVTTPYVVLHGDDEFYLPDALKECALFLDKHESYSAVCGVSISFNYEEKLLTGYKGYQNWNHHLSNSNGLKRAIEHFGRYSPDTIYGVWRISQLKIAATYASRFPWSCGTIGELLIEAYACLSGKTKIISHLQWLRSYENPPIETEDVNRSLTYEQWVRTYKNEFNVYVEALSDMVVQTGAIPPDMSAHSAAIMIHEAYMRLCYRYRGGWRGAIRADLKRYLPKYAIQFLKKIINMSRIKPSLVAETKNFWDIVSQLKESGIHVDFEELKMVELEVIDFYNKRK